jgi:hypothetical protein
MMSLIGLLGVHCPNADHAKTSEMENTVQRTVVLILELTSLSSGSYWVVPLFKLSRTSCALASVPPASRMR